VSLSGPVDGGPPGLTVHGPESGQHVTRRHDPEQHSAHPTAEFGLLQSTTPVLVGLLVSADTPATEDTTATATRKARNSPDTLDMADTSITDSAPKMGAVIGMD
jgi:hypothetical protein